MKKSKDKILPEISFRDIDPLQDCYVDGNGDQYGVARLIDATQDLEPFDCPLAALDLSYVPWKGFNIYELAFHCKRVMECDLSKPIILDWNGVIADGRHRVMKAIIEGKLTIKAVRLTWKPSPCRPEESE